MSTPSTRTSTSTRTSSSASQADPAPRQLGFVGKAATIVLMAIGSVLMWIGVPVGLIYLVSKMVTTTQPTLGPYLIILFGLPIGMTVIGKGLGALDRFYGRRTGAGDERRQASWMKSMRGERKTSTGRWKVLDVVMIWSVSTALVAFGVWFFAFAGSSI